MIAVVERQVWFGKVRCRAGLMQHLQQLARLLVVVQDVKVGKLRTICRECSSRMWGRVAQCYAITRATPQTYMRFAVGGLICFRLCKRAFIVV